MYRTNAKLENEFSSMYYNSTFIMALACTSDRKLINALKPHWGYINLKPTNACVYKIMLQMSLEDLQFSSRNFQNLQNFFLDKVNSIELNLS